jgi:hypothetical protein
MSVHASTNLEMVILKILDNLKTVKYGDVSVSLKIHDGRVVSIIHSVTQSIREIQEKI